MVVSSDYLEAMATRKQTMMIGELPRARKIPSSWRWNNIPLPEPHIAGIAARIAIRNKFYNFFVIYQVSKIINRFPSGNSG